MDKQFDTPEPVSLVAELGSGTLHSEATQTARSTVEITGPRAEEFTVQLAGNRLSVVAPRGRGLFGGSDHHDVHVVIPTGSDLDTRTGSADTEATGAYGAVRAKTGSGDFEVEVAESSVVVDSGSGAVRCDSVGASLRIRSGSGDIEIGEVKGTVAISTGSGDVVVGRTRGAAGVKTGSGDVSILRAAFDLTLTTGSGNLNIAHAERGSIRGKTGSGDMRIGIPAGTPVWTDLNSQTGRVRSDLPPLGKPAAGQDYVELRLRTGTGDITLTQVDATVITPEGGRS